MKTDTPLFIPLKKKYFEQFKRGEKTVELRKYGKGWNESTVWAGRKVILSCGYSGERLSGIVGCAYRCETGNRYPDFVQIYGPNQPLFFIEIYKIQEIQK